MTLDLQLYDLTKSLTKADSNFIVDILNFASNYLKLDNSTELSVTIVNDSKMKIINKKYRNQDKTTDVISFAIEDITSAELPIIMPDNLKSEIPRNLGDLFISIETAKRQAKQLNHSFNRELGFLLVHGLLHLNGYDHKEKLDEKKMFDLQREIMDKYGLKR